MQARVIVAAVIKKDDKLFFGRKALDNLPQPLSLITKIDLEYYKSRIKN